MTGLSIDRLSATAAAEWPLPAEVGGMLNRIAGSRLERALAEQPLPDGEWCVRRLDVDVDLDPERPLSALETDWADRIVTSLRLSLRDGSRDVVRYRRPEQAVDDLLRGVVTGRIERDWAWRQVGLLQPGDPDPRSDARSVFLAVIARLPQGPSAALDRLVRRTGLAPVHRLLGREGWRRLAALAAPDADIGMLLGDPVGGPPPGHPERPAGAAGARAMLARTLAETGTLPAAVRSAGIRADLATTRAWALLTVAAADPSLLHRGVAALAALVRAVATLLAPGPARSLGERAAGQPGATPPLDGTAGSDASADSTVSPPAGGTVGDSPAVSTGDVPAPATDPRPRDLDAVGAFDPVDDGDPTPAHTGWGGLAFLLNAAADAGLPEVLDEPPFLARPAAWVLRWIGRELVGAVEDDPVLLALAGTDAVPADPPDDAEQEAILVCAERWAAVTATRLRDAGLDDPDHTDTDIVRELARRQATILAEPGWVEVGLRLADVDLDVRRAGLDIDPGWVWWLGQVVRFRYE